MHVIGLEGRNCGHEKYEELSMAPWSFLSGSGSEAEAELPAHMEADADQSRTAFTIFIDGALTNIYNEASGRSKDQRALRASLKGVIGEIQSASTYKNVKNVHQVIGVHLSIHHSIPDDAQHLLDVLTGFKSFPSQAQASTVRPL